MDSADSGSWNMHSDTSFSSNEWSVFFEMFASCMRMLNAWILHDEMLTVFMI
jgi:hypothetical protein